MCEDYKHSTTEWMDLVSITNTRAYGGGGRVYRRAVAQIDVTVDLVSRVLLAKKLNIKKWLAPAYVALAPVQSLSKHQKPKRSGCSFTPDHITCCVTLL